jgi:hypothetical protein
MMDNVGILSSIIYLNRGVTPANIVTTDFNPLKMQSITKRTVCSIHFCHIGRAYGTLFGGFYLRWVKTHRYKIFRAYGSIKKYPYQTA